MNLHHRKSELINYIDQLQLTANKHQKNGEKDRFNLISQILEERKSELKNLNIEIERNNRILFYRVDHAKFH